MTSSGRPTLQLFLSLVAATTPFSGCENSSDDDSGPVVCDRTVDTNLYEQDLKVEWSQSPPGGFKAEQVPLFVAFGWDDNGFLDPFDWSVEMLEERELRNSFFHTTTYISDGSTSGNPNPLRGSWRGAYELGHEVGNHTHGHLNGTPFSGEEWGEEIDTATDWLTLPFLTENSAARPGLGVPEEEIYGFRSPFLNYNDALFDQLLDRNFWYDCSIEEGWQLDMDARSFPWPYTLDEGSPGHDYLQKLGWETRDFDLSAAPGLIELPVYALVIPPDSLADEYDFEPGLLDRIREHEPEWEEGSDRMTGLDFNLWWETELSRAEALAILKFNLDERLKGNRAPFLFGLHTDVYRETWGAEGPPENQKDVESFENRRGAIEDFLDYAAGIPEVRFATFKEVADYMREPRHIDCFNGEEGAAGAGGR